MTERFFRKRRLVTGRVQLGNQPSFVGLASHPCFEEVAHLVLIVSIESDNFSNPCNLSRAIFGKSVQLNDQVDGGRNLCSRHIDGNLAQAMKGWLTELRAGQPVHQHHNVPSSGTGVGLTEAPRGALGHWLEITSKKISHYQAVTPTCWNASPRDTNQVRGPIEQALIGTPVQKVNEPIGVLRVIHSFDPCLSCAVHVMHADSNDEGVIIHSRGGV